MDEEAIRIDEAKKVIAAMRREAQKDKHRLKDLLPKSWTIQEVARTLAERVRKRERRHQKALKECKRKGHK